jgi:hypothetical protein
MRYWCNWKEWEKGILTDYIEKKGGSNRLEWKTKKRWDSDKLDRGQDFDKIY